MDNKTLIGCLSVIGIIIFSLVLGFLFVMLVAKGVLMVSSGLFNYDLNDKYWYVVLLLYIINIIFGSKFVKVNYSN